MKVEDIKDKADRIEFNTGVLFENFYPTGAMRRTYRNGTVALFQYNGLFYAFNRFEKAPSSFYVDCDTPEFAYVTRNYDASTAPPTNDPDKYNAQAPLLTTITNWYQVASGNDPNVDIKTCAECLVKVKAFDYKTQFWTGNYLCEYISAAVNEYTCYAEITDTKPTKDIV